MDALLSIKEKYASKILSGEKTFELRKNIFKKKVDFVAVYVSKPVGKIKFAFKVGRILEDDPASLWEKVSSRSGISKEEYFSYFKNKNKAFAIEIKSIFKFSKEIVLDDFFPPQSWSYVTEDSKLYSILREYIGKK